MKGKAFDISIVQEPYLLAYKKWEGTLELPLLQEKKEEETTVASMIRRVREKFEGKKGAAGFEATLNQVLASKGEGKWMEPLQGMDLKEAKAYLKTL